MSEERYNELLARVTKRVREEHAQRFEELLPIIQRLGADRVLKDQITKQPVLPSEIGPAQPDARTEGRESSEQNVRRAEGSQEQRPVISTSGELPVQGVVSARTSSPREKPRPTPKIDWAEVGDLGDLKRELEEERRKREAPGE